MGKTAILIVVASVLFGSMYAFGAKEEAHEAGQRLSKHQVEVLARNAALAGYNVAKQELSESFSGAPASLSGTYAGDAYSVTITRSGSLARVVSTGTSSAGGAGDVSFTVDAAIEKDIVFSQAEEAPPFMRYAVMTEENLSINGNILTDLYVDGNQDNTLNANMHTNGNLHISGNAATVRGFGTYVGSASANPSSALDGTFDPYYNPTNDPDVQQVPAVDIPTFDVATMLSKTTVDQTTSGDLSMSGTYDLGGTREDPFVWHVDGNLSASGGVVINGYVMFIVEGNVGFSGNFEAGESGYDGGDESSVALYATGSIDMQGNSRIYGQIYTGTGVNFLGGTPRVFGSLATTGSVTLSGTPKIYYRVPSPALTTVFEDPEIHLSLVSYSEW